MKLYYSPGACSIATRISLHDAGIPAEYEQVDLKAKVTERGDDYLAINPAGAVPMLVLDDGQAVTENVAILTLIAERAPKLGIDGPLGQIRLIEMLSYLSTELHAAFKPYFHATSEDEKEKAAEAVGVRLNLLASKFGDPYLLGSHFTVVDAYFFAMLRWAREFGIDLPTPFPAYFDRLSDRSAVRQSLLEEGLASPLIAA
ncbi:glutathione binding-like protein [Sphingomonas sp. G124]|uniref:Glutathione binding-like protein n=1 Tax=Sphingomonas cremea TaxID=2904799 RepID=A0A9X1QLP3_9SPHN|nr:glutathione binding-like protein [Sphingomonas cremea]MCF2515390.1 glutathione binding-like protein [Sphingomonas cremea]